MRFTKSEQKEYKKLVSEWWTVYRSGWPDFLAEKDGKFRFIEVKSGDQRLAPNQMRMCHALYRMTKTLLEVRVYQK